MDILSKLLPALQERRTKRNKLHSSMFKGVTVGELLKLFDIDKQDVVRIKVDKENYDENKHSFLIVDKVNFKQNLVKKEFKENITVRLSNIDDALRIMPQTLKAKSSYGYVIKLDITIKT